MNPLFRSANFVTYWADQTVHQYSTRVQEIHRQSTGFGYHCIRLIIIICETLLKHFLTFFVTLVLKKINS